MRWQVAISDFKGDLRLLRDVLAGLSAGLIEEDGQLFLTSAEFEALGKSGDVHTQATRIVAAINGANYGDLADWLRLTLGSLVAEQKEDGRRLKHHVLVLEAAEFHVTGHSAALFVGANANLPEDDRKRIEADLKEREYQRHLRTAKSRVRSAYRDDQARKVQQLLQAELDTQTLYHIFEIVRGDMKGAFEKLATKDQQARFTHSMNHPKVLGEKARHAVSTTQPPSNPMRLDEARQFIRNLAERWMEHKAGLNDGN